MEQQMNKVNDLENKHLACTCHSATRTASGVLMLEDENKSQLSSSNDKDSITSTEVTLIHASASREDRLKECYDTGDRELVCTCQIAARMDTGDARDAIMLENENELWLSSSKESDDKESLTSTEVALIQASVLREEIIKDSNDTGNILEHKELACTCLIAARMDSGSVNDVLMLENENESWLSSYKQPEDKDSSTPTEVASIQASILREDRIIVCNDIADNLEKKELACTCHIATRADAGYANDVLNLENENESWLPSSKESSTPTEVAIIQASILRKGRIKDCSGIGDKLEIRELTCTCQTASMTDTVDSIDILKLENDNESWVSSEEPEDKESPSQTEVVLIQASDLGEDMIKECHDSADKLVHEILVCTCRVAARMDTVDSTDVLELNQNKSSVSSSERDEVSEVKESSTPAEVVLIGDSVLVEDRMKECNDIINYQDEEANHGAELISAFETRFNVRMENTLYRAPRYFDPPECSLWPCYQPDGNSDKYKRSKKRKRKPCYYCGEAGHRGTNCKHLTACFICSKKGHLIKDCPRRNTEVDNTSSLCFKCGNEGHDMFTCESDYSCEDLKGIQCYICKDTGHLCCVDYEVDVPTEASCYKCGELGHFGSDCVLTEVPVVLEPVSLCSKCMDSGYVKRNCRKCKKKQARKAAAAAKKADAKGDKSRKHRRPRGGKLPMPIPRVHLPPNPHTAVWRPRLSESHTTMGNPDQIQPQFPPLIWDHQQRTQTPQKPLNHQTLIPVPRSETQVPPGPFFLPFT